MSEKQVSPYPIRLTLELREKLEESARASGRSLNAEMLLRLDASYVEEGEIQSLTAAQVMEVRRIVREELRSSEVQPHIDNMVTGQEARHMAFEMIREEFKKFKDKVIPELARSKKTD